jgi:hypothetical protein
VEVEVLPTSPLAWRLSQLCGVNLAESLELPLTAVAKRDVLIFFSRPESPQQGVCTAWGRCNGQGELDDALGLLPHAPEALGFSGAGHGGFSYDVWAADPEDEESAAQLAAVAPSLGKPLHLFAVLRPQGQEGAALPFGSRASDGAAVFKFQLPKLSCKVRVMGGRATAARRPRWQSRLHT